MPGLPDDALGRNTPGQDPPAPLVAYVGGIGRSGSTLLCRMLAAVPGVLNVGEICYLWNQSVLNDRLCSCGQPFSRCPFWSAVGRSVLGSWDPGLATEQDRVRRLLERNRRLPLLAFSHRGHRAQQADDYAHLIGRVLRGVAAVGNARVLVDNSKLPSSALIRRRDALEVRVIHLVRSPFGVAHSWSRAVARADFDGRPMQRFPAWRSAADWSAYNLAFEALRPAVPTLAVRYEDLVAQPRTQLDRCLRFLGIQEADLSFIDDGQVELGPDHSVWGNPTRVSSGRQALKVDESWRTDLGLRDRLAVAALTAPGLLRYGYLRRR